MAKPWGKYEIDYLDHPKFRALNANAIVLWLEAKNHCDKFQTDGRFPREIAKTFRYYSSKAVELLTRSCGVKPNGDAYTPLWAAQDIGGVNYYQMHDYLDYNDCRDAVLERMQDSEQRAELRRQKNKERQQRFRDERDRTLRNASNSVTESVTRNAGNALVTRVTSTPTETETVTKERKNTPPKEPADPQVRQFIEWFQAEYKTRRHGADYLVKWGRDSSLVKPMLKATTYDRLQKYAQILLSDKCDEPWVVDTDRGITILSMKFNWLSDRLAQWELRQKGGAA